MVRSGMVEGVGAGQDESALRELNVCALQETRMLGSDAETMCAVVGTRARRASSAVNV